MAIKILFERILHFDENEMLSVDLVGDEMLSIEILAGGEMLLVDLAGDKMLSIILPEVRCIDRSR